MGIIFPEVRTSSVRLIWQPPAQPNGIILGEFTHSAPHTVPLVCPRVHTPLTFCTPVPHLSVTAYQITYRRNSSTSNAATVDVLSPSARQYTATSLKPESVYVFRLTAQTRKGWGEAAEALVVTTEKRGTKLTQHNSQMYRSYVLPSVLI